MQTTPSDPRASFQLQQALKNNLYMHTKTFAESAVLKCSKSKRKIHVREENKKACIISSHNKAAAASRLKNG